METKSYLEWSKMLQQLQEGTDRDALQIALTSRFGGTDASLIRWLKRIQKTIDKRLELAKENFQKGQERFVHSEADLVMTLGALREEFQFAMEITGIIDLPEDIRQSLREYVQTAADTTQDSLESLGYNDPMGKMKFLVSQNAVNRLEPVPKEVDEDDHE